jgi:hypothetical protein
MIKLDFVEKGSDECPLIRIFGDEPFNGLVDSFFALSHGQVDSVIVEDLPNYESIKECHLVMAVGGNDNGILRNSESCFDFTWIMTRSSWEDLAELAEPFYKFSGYRYQWLAGGEARMPKLAMSDIALLISTYPDGQW